MSAPIKEVGESATRRIVRRRSMGICEACGRRPASEKAHRVGKAVGGRWNPSNILDACRKCHHENHMHPTNAYAKGQHLNSWQDPATTKVTMVILGARRTVLLDDKGGYKDAPAEPASTS